MLIRSFKAELMKLRRSFIWLALAVLPFISALLGTLNFFNNIGMLKKEWYSLWTQHALFYCTLFAPALTGVYCAYVCRLEHLNRNWNMVMTQPVSAAAVVLSKLAVVSVLSALTQALIGVFFIISGKIAGFTAPIPVSLVYWLVRGWLSLTVYASLLLIPSLLIRSFAVPVALGLIGGFVGLPALIKGFGVYYPFSLLPLSMCSHNPAEPMDCPAVMFIISCLAYLLAGVVFCTLWLRRTDVKTA